MQIIHHHFESLSSTNDWAKQELSSFPQDQLILITADKQTKGRGQYGRRWISVEGNLYATFCFFAREADTLSFTYLLALRVVALLDRYGVEATLKWPNDVFVKGKKIAGILCETVPLSANYKKYAIVIGLGLNVNIGLEELVLIDQPATSLFVETMGKWNISHIVDELANNFILDVMRPCSE